MPELAEVEFFRRQWDCGLGQKIIAVQIHPRKRIFRGTNTRQLVSKLKGRRLVRSFARGKQLLFEFSSGNWIGIHLGMSGKLRTEPSGFHPLRHDHLVLQQKRQALVLSDARLFGRVRFHQGRSTPDWWRAGGPDIGSEQFNRSFLDDFLARHQRAPIKSVLLLQSGFNGIGNWMADEILWRAKIAPSTSPSTLSATQRARLFRETQFVASESLGFVGREFPDPPADWLIHQKWKRTGVCPRHQSPLRKEIIGGRTTAWCPRCQRS
ncbi:MAG TPA: DNA-formamidopyrimidine glycosylase family protein [Chthoniobacterales bacterium]|nr:DNA-formamidopyrimidine glycosylase family protein [Chthoniobacterales bacterium]